MIMNEHAVPRPGPVDRVETIERRFQSMHLASRELPAFTGAERKAMLRALRDAIRAHAGEFAQAIAYDFGWRSHHETLMTEVVPALGIIKDALSNLDRWMRPERRSRSLSFWPARNKVYWQPKGVVLIVSPWNYPMQLAVAPLAAAVAAGNRVVLKPSETAPATAQLLKRHVEEALGGDIVTVATGGAEMAQALCGLPFDHILFTGSTAVGRLVMQAAAHNLTPVTLELGGKSPAIVHGDFDHALAAARIARGKLLNAGQTCIAPDYALVRRDRVDQFVRLYRGKTAALYPSLVDNRDYTSIVDDRHYGRLAGLVADARAKGARVDTVDPAGELGAGEIGVREKRRMLPALVVDPPPEAALMREEIFGPILPVLPYDTLEAAIAFVAARPRPLALYYFDDDRARVDQVLRSTVSGGASINDTIFHFAQEGLPFGGVGESGMGSYHGYEGFRTFSHGKGVFLQARRNITDLLMPPYGARFRRLIGFAVRRNG
jgi:acyl-CoA reductase-like NAD-dependent aldehyde dehydrogenase